MRGKEEVLTCWLRELSGGARQPRTRKEEWPWSSYLEWLGINVSCVKA